ncbi:hypothetical protein BD626DRAFT_475512 [Schizophyllum amplum]|uniref:DUF1264-domain-containing protein n=1 Tax=Schizophyllum amplum TaxID=97359 RepID=A0A550CYI2_9AGAR|nr:hypothetical protein BD626DRAFT_475512 [Auriculariopsis ampla]
MSTSAAKDIVQEPITTKDAVLETGASVIQEFQPVNNICAHLNAYHIYADDPSRVVEAQHYCTHISKDVRQCIIYDSPEKNARLIGVEYMITPRLYEELPPDERKLWHSHVFEVKSGQLIMPQPSTSLTPAKVWEQAELKEMEEVIGLYGKTYHLWQVDRGDAVPLGSPKLMMSFTHPTEGFEKVVTDRDKRYGVNHEEKARARAYIPEPKIHPDADNWDHRKQA